MKYSARYMDIKDRPMFMHNTNMGLIEILLKLVKVAFWTTATFVLIVAVVYFVQNITYWGL